MTQDHQTHIPVYIFTGFLGSGKTTLLREVMRSPRMERTALIVNEFGQTSLDDHLLRPTVERLALVQGGCACCQVREDLVVELGNIISENDSLENQVQAIAIETTGLADPVPIVFTILTHPMLQHQLRVAGVFTTIDAVCGMEQLDQQPECVKQVLASDKLIVTKADVSDPDYIETLCGKLRTINPTADILLSENGNLGPDVLFAVKDVVRTPVLPQLPITFSHTEKTEAVSVLFTESVNWPQFMVWLSLLLHSHGDKVLRIKGMIDTGDRGPVVFHAVQHVVYPPEHLREWPHGEQRSILTFIVRGIERQELLNSVSIFSNYFRGGTAEE